MISVRNCNILNVFKRISVRAVSFRHLPHFSCANNLRRDKKSPYFRPPILNGEKCSRIVTSYRFFADFPEHKKIPLPALSPTMESGTIVSWAKKEGDKLNEGDLLAEIETDKATMAFETPVEGYLAKILVPAGTRDIPVGKLVCIIVEKQEDVGKFKSFKDESPAAAAPQAAKGQSTPSPTPSPTPSFSQGPPEPRTEKGRIYASPMAKNLAAKRGIRLEDVGKGTGIHGSITSKDLDGAKPPSPRALAAAPQAKAGPAPPSKPQAGANFVDIPVTSMRAVIGKRLLESKTTIPHFYLFQEICVDQLLKHRQMINKELEKKKLRISVNDFVIKATAMASRKVPEVNSHWLGNVIRQYNSVDVSVAVSTDKGLLTPIIFDADKKGLTEISQEMKALAKKAREGKLQPKEFQGGTISVSNLGMFGTSAFCAIINPPHSTIVAVGTNTARYVPVNGEPVAKQFVTISLSCDHRVVDGAVGAQWLKVMKDMMESPFNMLL